jgi:mono/diheme cytochrome c family protein
MNIRTVGLLIGIVLSRAISASADTESSRLFKTKCSSCHTFGKGDLIGPDLKGVNDRHARPWLIAWIRSSASVLSKRDPDAVALFRKYRQQRMPDHALSDAQIVALLDYLAAGGPSLDAPTRIRFANTATEEEIVRGQQLFFGAMSLASGGLACAACHSVSKHGGLGGTLAADLSDVYTRYLDWALDRKLKQAATHSAAVAESESLALRAFLRAVAARQSTGPSR